MTNSSGDAVLNSNISKWQGMTVLAPISFASCAASGPKRFPGTLLSGARPLMGSNATCTAEVPQLFRHLRISDRVAARGKPPSLQTGARSRGTWRGPVGHAPQFRGPRPHQKIECPRLQPWSRHPPRWESRNQYLASPQRSRDSIPRSPAWGVDFCLRMGRAFRHRGDRCDCGRTLRRRRTNAGRDQSPIPSSECEVYRSGCISCE